MIRLIIQIALLALGVAVSPLPIVALLVILLTRRARVGSLAMLVAWVLGVVVMLGISVAFADRLVLPPRGEDLPAEALVTVLLGVGLVMMAVLSRRGRFRLDDPEQPPAWVNSVDNLSPAGGAVVVFLNATTSPKNIALAITAGRALVSPGVDSTQATVAAVVYVVVASMSIAAPVGLYLFGGDAASAILLAWKRRVTAHAAAVMEITLLILGLGLTARGLFNLLR